MQEILIEILFNEYWKNTYGEPVRSENPMRGVVLGGDGSRLSFANSTIILTKDNPIVFIERESGYDLIEEKIISVIDWGPETIDYMCHLAMGYNGCIISNNVLADPFVHGGRLDQPIICKIYDEDYDDVRNWAKCNGLL